jgi:hypothetical protein
MNSGGSFGSNPLELHFGLGESERVEFVEVDWPTTGNRQRLSGPEINRRIEIVEENQAAN